MSISFLSDRETIRCFQAFNCPIGCGLLCNYFLIIDVTAKSQNPTSNRPQFICRGPWKSVRIVAHLPRLCHFACSCIFALLHVFLFYCMYLCFFICTFASFHVILLHFMYFCFSSCIFYLYNKFMCFWFSPYICINLLLIYLALGFFSYAACLVHLHICINGKYVYNFSADVYFS